MIDPRPFLEKVFAAMAQCNIVVAAMELDHVCYRVEGEERYGILRKELEADGTLLGESLIGGRSIATYRLHRPFLFDERRIDVVELPAPKPGSFYPEGYEHVEFVVNEDLQVFAQKHPHLAWDLSGASKTVNADVRLRFDGFSVKFHRQPLADVIGMETGGLTKEG